MTIGAPPPPPGQHGGPPPGGPFNMIANGPPPFSDRPRQPPPGGPGHQPEPFQREENEQFLRRAVELLEKLVEEQPTNPDYQHLLARCCRDLPPAWPPDPDTEPVGQTDRAIEILEELVESHPGVPAYRADLVDSYLRASLQFDPEALATEEYRLQLQKALRGAQRLVAEHPNVPRYSLSQVHEPWWLRAWAPGRPTGFTVCDDAVLGRASVRRVGERTRRTGASRPSRPLLPRPLLQRVIPQPQGLRRSAGPVPLSHLHRRGPQRFGDLLAGPAGLTPLLKTSAGALPVGGNVRDGSRRGRCGGSGIGACVCSGKPNNPRDEPAGFVKSSGAHAVGLSPVTTSPRDAPETNGEVVS